MRKFWSCGAHVKSKTNNAIIGRWCNLLPQNVERAKPYAWKCSLPGRVHPHSVLWTWGGYLLHRYHWCCMVSIKSKRLHSAQFVFSQPRFVAVLQKLAMEVHKPSSQLAEEKTLETLNRISWEKAARRQALHEPMKMSWHRGKRRNRPKNGSKFWYGAKHSRTRRSATAPHYFF